MSDLRPASIEGQLGAFCSSHVICRGSPPAPAPKRVTFSLALCTLSRTGAGGDVLGGASTPAGLGRGPETPAWPASGRVSPGTQGLWVVVGWWLRTLVQGAHQRPLDVENSYVFPALGLSRAPCRSRRVSLSLTRGHLHFLGWLPRPGRREAHGLIHGSSTSRPCLGPWRRLSRAAARGQAGRWVLQGLKPDALGVAGQHVPPGLLAGPLAPGLSQNPWPARFRPQCPMPAVALPGLPPPLPLPRPR